VVLVVPVFLAGLDNCLFRVVTWIGFTHQGFMHLVPFLNDNINDIGQQEVEIVVNYK
jgi:hypothetical protein